APGRCRLPDPGGRAFRRGRGRPAGLPAGTPAGPAGHGRLWPLAHPRVLYRQYYDHHAPPLPDGAVDAALSCQLRPDAITALLVSGFFEVNALQILPTLYNASPRRYSSAGRATDL